MWISLEIMFKKKIIKIWYFSKMMTRNGYIDILLYIPIDEIICKGIPHVRSLVDEWPFQAAYNSFRNNFTKAWILIMIRWLGIWMPLKMTKTSLLIAPITPWNVTIARCEVVNELLPTHPWLFSLKPSKMKPENILIYWEILNLKELIKRIENGCLPKV